MLFISSAISISYVRFFTFGYNVTQICWCVCVLWNAQIASDRCWSIFIWLNVFFFFKHTFTQVGFLHEFRHDLCYYSKLTNSLFSNYSWIKFNHLVGLTAFLL